MSGVPPVRARERPATLVQSCIPGRDQGMLVLASYGVAQSSRQTQVGWARAHAFQSLRRNIFFLCLEPRPPGIVVALAACTVHAPTVPI